MAHGSSVKQPNHFHFALLIEEKPGRLSQRDRMIAEKRIMDILFEIEINDLKGDFIKMCKLMNYPLFKSLHYI